MHNAVSIKYLSYLLNRNLFLSHKGHSYRFTGSQNRKIFTALPLEMRSIGTLQRRQMGFGLLTIPTTVADIIYTGFAGKIN